MFGTWQIYRIIPFVQNSFAQKKRKTHIRKEKDMGLLKKDIRIIFCLLVLENQHKSLRFLLTLGYKAIALLLQ